MLPAFIMSRMPAKKPLRVLARPSSSFSLRLKNPMVCSLVFWFSRRGGRGVL